MPRIDKINKLFELCVEPKIDTDAIEKYILSEKMTSDEISHAFLLTLYKLAFEYSDFLENEGREPRKGEIASLNIPDVTELLLRHNLNPNYVGRLEGSIGDYSLLWQVKLIGDNYICHKTMHMLLENGGDPNLECDSCSVFEDIDFDIIFDIREGEDVEQCLRDKDFYLWLMLIGYGGRCENGDMAVEMQNGYSPEIFKDYERFIYEVEYGKRDFDIRVICRDTGELVAIG